jgi:tetratricopeptide (TPR) repeat protein
MTVLVDDLLARGWLARDGEVWRLTVPRPTIEREVPDNTRQLIEGQLRFLSPAERDVLEVASVAGVSFDAPAVAAGLGGRPEGVESICHRLHGASRWLRYLGSREWPDGTLAARYSFRHGLYRVTLYDRLPPSRRVALHQRIGERLEAGYAGRTAEVSGELAGHFEGSRDHPRALAYLEQAAARAYDRRAYRDVIACLEPALRLLAGLPDAAARARDELRLRRMYAVVLSQTAGYAAEAVRENLVRTQTLAERLADAAALLDVLGEVYLHHAASGRLLEAERIAGGQSRVAESLDSTAALRADFMQGAVAVWMGNLEAAEPPLARALGSPVSLEDAERPYAVNPLVAARSHEGLRRWLTGDAAGARAVLQEGLALAERHGAPFTLAPAASFRATVLVLEEGWTEARRLAERAIELADQFGFVLWRGLGLVIRGRARVEEGEGNTALAEIREGLEAWRAAGHRLGSSLCQALLAGACLRLDLLDEGLEAADVGLAHCRDTGERLLEAELWRLRGELLRRRQDPEAEACFEKARAVAHAQGAHTLERRAGRRALRAPAAREAPRS